MLKYLEIIEKLSVKQKIALLTDIGCLSDPEYNLLGIPYTSIATLDDMIKGLGEDATAFTLSRSWNTSAVESLTEELTERALEEGKNFMISPSPKIKFDPYSAAMSEDPHLAARMAISYVNGIHNVGLPACISGFSLNADDISYMDPKPDGRVIYEYFVRPFRIAANESECHSVLASVSGPGGEYGELNKNLMISAKNEVFHGKMSVLCDDHSPEATAEIWHAGGIVLQGEASVLEMAFEQYQSIKKSIEEGHSTIEELEAAYADGSAISEEMIDAAVDRVIEFAFVCKVERKKQTEAHSHTEGEEHHHTNASEGNGKYFSEDICKAIRDSVVLLKNDRAILPINSASRIAIIGDVAMQGSDGESFADRLIRILPNTCVDVARGYELGADKSEELIAKAMGASEKADVVLLFLGIDDERKDKLHVTKRLELPANQMALLEALEKYGNKIVGVVRGEVVPDASIDRKMRALMLAPVGGEHSARALADIVIGKYSPSGRLTETYYDMPDELFATLKGYKDAGRNKVGPFMGYRHYDSAELAVRYPFGFGLSYSKFVYSGLKVRGNGIRFKVANKGHFSSAETVQIYVGKRDSDMIRPRKELKKFIRVELSAGESREICVDDLDLMIFDKNSKTERIEEGTYEIYVCSSVSDVRLKAKAKFNGEKFVFADDEAERRSDYLQSESNIVAEQYTLEAEFKKMKRIWRWKILSLLFLVTTVLLDIGLIYLGVDFGLGVALINIILLVVALIFFIVDRKKTAKLKMLAAEEMRARAAEHFEGATEVKSLSVDELFAVEFDQKESEDEAASEKKGVDLADYAKYVDHDLSFGLLCNSVKQFASERGLSFADELPGLILSSFATSRLLHVTSSSKKNLHKICGELGNYFGCPCFVESIGVDHLTSENILVVKDEYGNSRDTAVMDMIRSAGEHKETVHFVLLENVRCKDIGELLSPYIRYFNNPLRTCKVSLKDTEESYVLPENLWFMVSFAGGERYDDIPVYIAELMTRLDLDYIDCEPLEDAEYRTLGYYQLRYLSESVRNGFVMSEELWKKVDDLDKYVEKHSRYHFGNKLWLKMEKYVSVLSSCEHEAVVALDYTLANNILTAIQVLLKDKIADDDRGLLEAIEFYFGEENVSACRNVMKMNVEPTETLVEESAEVIAEEASEAPVEVVAEEVNEAVVEVIAEEVSEAPVEVIAEEINDTVVEAKPSDEENE